MLSFKNKKILKPFSLMTIICALLLAAACAKDSGGSNSRNSVSDDNAGSSNGQAQNDNDNADSNLDASDDDIANADAADTAPSFATEHKNGSGTFVFEATKQIHLVQLPAATGGNEVLNYTIAPPPPTA